MSKPDWKDAPEWANYLAQDGNGAWYWFANKPKFGMSEEWWCDIGNYEEAQVNEGWRETLESRP